MRPRAAGLLATHDGSLTPSILGDRRPATRARQTAHGAAHAGARHAAPLSAAAHDLLRLWRARARHHRRDLLDQGSADPHPCRACLHRRLADAALDHQDGVRPARGFRADPWLRAPRLCLYRCEPGRERSHRSCRRRRRLDRFRRQECALRCRSAPHRDRRRAARRGRRRHDHRGRRPQKPRRHAASSCRGRARARPRSGAGKARAVVRHPFGRRPLGVARANVQLRDRVPSRADRSRHLGYRRHPGAA